MLTPKQRRFVQEYLKDSNAKQAAIRAGYSDRCAQSQGSRLLSYAEVKAAIDAGTQRIAAKAEVDATFVLTNLQQVITQCLQPYQRVDAKGEPILDKDGHQAYAIDSAGANRAIELVGKHLKMFVDKVEVSGDEKLADQLSKAIQRTREVPDADHG